MSTLRVTAEPLVVHPHPNADALELAQVGLYRAVVIDQVLALAEGAETVSGEGLHIREGVVIRPKTERHSDVLGGRAVAKAVGSAYLTRKGGTEFE